jgi:hypothetical protein
MVASQDFAGEVAEGVDIRPTIAITKARLTLPEISDAIDAGRLKIDGTVVHETRDVAVKDRHRSGLVSAGHRRALRHLDETKLRRTLFEQTGGMYPELVTRPDIKVFLPPIGNTTLYLFGDPCEARRPAPSSPAACMTNATARTCSARTSAPAGPISCTASRRRRRDAQKGGVGFIVYNRKEGRALGEVTKFLVYNARKRQDGGDQAATYFERTECVAGVQDARFQQLMPDVMHWLGIRRIDRFMSMSNMKHDALVEAACRPSASGCRSPTT